MVLAEAVAELSALVALGAGLVGLYVALRHETRRSHELLQKDISHVQGDLAELRADVRRVDQKIDDVRGELIGYLGSR